MVILMMYPLPERGVLWWFALLAVGTFRLYVA